MEEERIIRDRGSQGVSLGCLAKEDGASRFAIQRLAKVAKA
jgi:hypothetical protein